MPTNISGISGAVCPKSWGGEPYHIPTYFTCNGNGVPTIGEDYDDRVSVTREDASGSPLVYLVSFSAAAERLLSCIVTLNAGQEWHAVWVTDTDAGTVEITITATESGDTSFDGEVHLLFCVSDSTIG